MKKLVIILVFITLLAILISAVLFINKTKTKNQTVKEPILKEVKLGNIPVAVTLALTPDERLNGLSGKKSLAENEGMLFIFEQREVRPAFWMKGMLIGLDFIWIADRKIVQIDKNVAAPPTDTLESLLQLYWSNVPVDHVLEVNSGFTDKNNVKVGDYVDLTQI